MGSGRCIGSSGAVDTFMGLTIAAVIPCTGEAADELDVLLPRLRSALARLRLPSGIVLVHGAGDQAITAVAERHGVQALAQRGDGYGGALLTAFADIDAEFLVTIEADAAHLPELVPYLCEHRHQSDIVIASRYVRQGFARMPIVRGLASRALNTVFRVALDLPVRDLSSGFRLYRRAAVQALAVETTSYAVLQEILIKAYCEGYAIAEIPMHYVPSKGNRQWRSRAGLGLDYLRTFRRMWALRNSVDSCDYDTRAFYSKIPLQRYWQRLLYDIITRYIGAACSTPDADRRRC